MKIALVDDDRLCLEKMAEICHKFGLQNQYKPELSLFSQGNAFLASFERDAYSIVFLDIFMQDCNGVDIAKQMRRIDSRCILIFLTSSTEFMPDAFSCHAFEYILKPFDEGRVFQVLQDAVSLASPRQKYCEITIERKTICLLLEDIVSVVTDAHYLLITLAEGKTLRSRMTASEFLQRTRNDPRFLSINKGVILNGDYIADFEDNCCILESGEKFSVRVRDRLKIEQAVRNHIFGRMRSRQRNFAETR